MSGADGIPARSFVRKNSQRQALWLRSLLLRRKAFVVRKLRRYSLGAALAGVILFAVMLALMLFFRVLPNSSYQISVLSLRTGSRRNPLEFFWATAHTLGLQNLGFLKDLVPAYRDTLTAASPARAAGEPPVLALTFDDAVGQNLTVVGQLLDLLEGRQVPATFFVIADDNIGLEQPRRMLRRMHQSGHELANHGLRDHFMSRMNASEFEGAIVAWEARVRQAVPDWPARPTDRRWFRPPQFGMNGRMRDTLARLNYTVALGDVYTDDWTLNDPDFHVGVALNVASHGSVIVLHVPDRPSRWQTLEITRRIVDSFRRRGFVFVRLSDMLAREQVTPPLCLHCWFCDAGAGLAVHLTAASLLLSAVFSAVACCFPATGHAALGTSGEDGETELGRTFL